MAEVILMPRLSDTMTEGVIAAWHKKVGDAVKKGDLLAEVETDKATMEMEVILSNFLTILIKIKRTLSHHQFIPILIIRHHKNSQERNNNRE